MKVLQLTAAVIGVLMLPFVVAKCYRDLDSVNASVSSASAPGTFRETYKQHKRAASA